MESKSYVAIIEKILFLNKGDFKRVLPFFIFYFVLFVLLYLGEGISLSLFISNVGASKLPSYYAITAVLNCVFVFVYLYYVDKISNSMLFLIIIVGTLLNYIIAYLLLVFCGSNDIVYGLFLIYRELAQTMIIVHFGNYLMDYFTRLELNRVLPVIYSGGRVGGITGGLILGGLSERLGVVNLLFIYFAIGFFCLFYLFYLKKVPFVKESSSERSHSISYLEFFKSILKYDFLLWLSLSAFFYFQVRFFLFYEYNNFFGEYFHSAEKLASFIGFYSIIALTVAILFQTLVINRLVAYIGLKGSLTLYNILLTIVMIWNLFPMSIFSAIFSRALENELRVGFRNPVVQLITNQLHKSVRARARAWILGGINPISILVASVFIGLLLNVPYKSTIAIVGICLVLIYIVATQKLFNTFKDRVLTFDFHDWLNKARKV